MLKVIKMLIVVIVINLTKINIKYATMGGRSARCALHALGALIHLILNEK